MIKHNAGAEEVGHALGAAKIFSLNNSYTSSSVIYQLLVQNTQLIINGEQ